MPFGMSSLIMCSGCGIKSTQTITMSGRPWCSLACHKKHVRPQRVLALPKASRKMLIHQFGLA